MSPDPDPLKFRPVVHLEDAVPRERLGAHVLSAMPGTARLTLVIAPAGFGKTTLMAQVAARLAAAGECVAWLNCSTQDREPDVFVDDLAQAWLAAGVDGVKGGMGLAEMTRALAASADPVTLFVDRYDLASTAELDPLLGTLATLLPSGARCLVATRFPPSLPTTAMELDGWLRVIDVEPLRFTDDEARALLSPALPDGVVGLVIDRAAGWPFVLQLARLRMAADGIRPVLGAGQAGLPTQEVFEYLAAQTFSALRADDVAFLVDVAVLETIDVASANAVRGRTDGAAFIERLKVMKPIVVVEAQPLRATLHPLLRDLLRSMLERDDEGGRTALLHVRAAQHFAATGVLHEAISHAVSGGRLELAAQILASAGGICLLVDQGVGRVRTLLSLLPPATVRRHPRLRLVRILQLLIEENGVEARLDLERLEASHPVEGLDDDTRLDLAITRAMMSVNEGEHVFRFAPWAGLDDAAARARERYCEDSRYLVLTLATEILMLQRYGPLERAERRTVEAQTLHREGRFSYNIPWTWIYRARNLYARGAVPAAREELVRALAKELDIFTFTHGSYGQMVHALLGKLCLDQGDVDEAFRHFEAIAPVPLMTLFEIHAGAYVYYPRCEFARGNATRALDMLARARQIAADDGLPHLDVLAAAHAVQILVATGRLDDAIDVARDSGIEHVLGIAAEPGALPSIEVDAVVAACFALSLAQGRLAAAGRIAADALDAATRAGRRLAELDAWLMTARHRLAIADAVAARDAIERALAIGAEGRVVEAFTWAGADAMSLVRAVALVPRHPQAAWATRVAASADDNVAERSAVDRLFTPRERDVLRGLMKGQSTKAIARELLLSPETIKHHLKAIFAKLDVRSRDDAVAAMRRRAAQ